MLHGGGVNQERKNKKLRDGGARQLLGMDFDECLMICLGNDLGAGQGRAGWWREGREEMLLLFYGAFK